MNLPIVWKGVLSAIRVIDASAVGPALKNASVPRRGFPLLFAATALIIIAASTIPAGVYAENGGASLSLSPELGAPGGTLEATGTGFSASTCGVDLFLDSRFGRKLGSVLFEPEEDSFKTEITVPPEVTAGEHRVLAIGLLLDVVPIPQLSSNAVNGSCGNSSGDEASDAFNVEIPEFLIRFKTRAFVPEPGINIGDIEAQRNGQPEDLVHFLAQFETLPDVAERKELLAKGVTLGPYVTGNAYIAVTRVADLPLLLDVPGLRWTGPLEPQDKASPEVQAGLIGSWAQTEDDRVVITVQPHQDVSVETIVELVRSLGGEISAIAPDAPSVTALFSFSQQLVDQLTDNDSVQYVDVAPPALDDQNDGARAAANVDPLLIAPFNLTGAGSTVLVFDSGVVDVSHPDFAGRVIEIDGDPTETTRDHSTHVAGTVAGSGANSNGSDSAGNSNGGAANQWAGMAAGANLRSFGLSGSGDVLYDDAGDLNGDFTTAITNGIDVATMSLGNNVVPNGFPCAQLGDYTNTAILLDNIVRGSIGGQQLIYFESAGNERTGTAPCGNFGTISSPSTAKNTISVGAINSNDNSITGFTSFGPTDDGRLKPDITAPGCQSNGDFNITSPSFIDGNGNGNLDAGETQNAYVGKCGTSMATPAAAGATALLIEQWRRTRPAGSRPLPHTAKAILSHTANDLGNAGPDFRFGWGALDAQAAVDLVIDDDVENLIHVESVDAGQTDFYTFHSDGSEPVQVTLAWDDPAGARLAAVTQVNDVDLRLVDPDGTVFQPLVLNAASPGNVAAPGNDALNNAERVIGAARAGTWVAEVRGTTVPQGPQEYTLITPEDAAQNRPPVADICDDAEAECAGAVSEVALDGTCSSDPDADVLTYQWSSATCSFVDDTAPMPKALCPLGVHTVSLVVTDAHGAMSAPDEATVSVVDTTPPVVACAPGLDTLWPPEHDLIDVGLVATAEDACFGPLAVTIDVTSDEDDLERRSSGRHSPDAKQDPDLRLRSERAGRQDGRVYLIRGTAVDDVGLSGHDCCTVSVTRDQSAASIANVTGQANAAEAVCDATAAPPADFLAVGDGPVRGPKQ
jgi:hypothetical protein